MPAEFKLDGLLKDSFSEPTRKVLSLFPEMLVSQEGILREYHKDTPAVLRPRETRHDFPRTCFRGLASSPPVASRGLFRLGCWAAVV